MCGRYSLVTSGQALNDTFEIKNDIDPEKLERHQIAPSDKQHAVTAPVVLQNEEERTLRSMTWPLIPHWAKGELTRYGTHNARSETAAEKPAFRQAWKQQQRCLVPATGFFEWQIVEDQTTKQPWFITLKRPLFAMAGLWDASTDDQGQTMHSFTILTVDANPLMAEIHNTRKRMPVILQPKQHTTWLAGDIKAAEGCLTQYPEADMQAVKISRQVNNPWLDDAAITQPLS